ncbi:MAG: glycosyltransferase [Bryobacteraceae bacterium]
MADDVYQAPLAPKVSVILTVRNQIAEVRRAISALESSRGREQMEILVVDRASEDGTPALDEEFPSVTMLRLPHDFGNTRAMNIAARTAKAESLFYLSPNVEVHPETVMALAERLQSDATAVAVCPLLVDANGEPVPQVLPTPDASLFREASEKLPSKSVPATDTETVDVSYPASDAWMVRRHFVAGMNYFDERLGHHWADADLALQIRRAGRRIRICTGIRATWNPPATQPNDIAHQADRILGGAVLLGKYYGFFSGFTFRWGAILGALVTLKMGLFGALLSDRKLDGADAN